MTKTKLQWKVLASICAIALSSCGGGDDSGSAATGTSANASGGPLSGTVAVGAPMMNTTLTVMGANGQTVSTPVDDSGSYASLNVAALTAPYRLQACGQADGQYECYYSVVQTGTVADVTPLTDAVIALALGTDASAVFTGSVPSASALASSEASLRNYLAPLLAAAGVQSTGDFATLSFTANHTGMDKVLDAVKVTTGHNNGAMFVQMQGVLGYGNAYLDSQGNQTGSLDGSQLVNGMSVDLTGISTIFNGLSNAIGSGSVSSCISTMSAQVPLDSGFALNMNGQQLTAATAPTALCTFAAANNLLGGKVENPALRSCSFSGAKQCTVGFDLSNGTLNVEGAEMAVVLEQNGTWALLGNDNAYGIQAGAAVQRTLNVSVSNPQPSYFRALSFDIPDTVASGGPAPHAAIVYIRDASGTGDWDTSSPIARLSDNGCASQGNLTISGSQCGAEWLSIDDFGSAELGAGDGLIDALYHRGLDLRIDLYSDASASTYMTTVYTHLSGLPPKSADLPKMPWLNLDAASQSALAAYDSSTVSTPTLNLAWTANTVVVPHDLTFCPDSSCNPDVHMELPGTSLQTSAKMDLSSITVAANGYKSLSLYGRDRTDVGYQSQYLSCGSQGC